MAWTKEQELAINESGKNIIVSAGAGSGKTAVLTARVMRLINEGIHVNEMLILTFTKAAAAEMKDRIRNNIKKGISDNPNLKKELELIDQSYVTTFDSYALSVVKKYHYLLNISNNISITDSSIIDLEKKKIIDKVFDEFYLRNDDRFNKLIYDFCIKDDEILKGEILNIATKVDSLVDRDNYLDSYNDIYLSNDFYNKCIEEYKEIISIKVDSIKTSEEDLYYYTEGDFETKCRDVLDIIYNYSNIDELINKLSILKLPMLPRGSEDIVKEKKELLKNEIDELKDIVLVYGNEEKIINNINISKEYILVIIDIVKRYMELLHEYKRNNLIYDFQDIALLSLKILREFSNVRNEIRDSFKQIMVDEYQDTNDIQETFISKIENNNVYMVGDIKQSIYRFRNANPYIFKSKYDKYSNLDGGIKIDLVKNFRSREEVLNNINLIFNYIMDQRLGGAEYHESHQMVFGNTTYNIEGKTKQNNDFEVLEYNYNKDMEYSKEEIEIFSVINDIKDKINNKYQVFDKDNKVLRDIKYSDFVILMDRASDFDLYKKIFEYKGIPLTLYKDDTLNNSYDIYIIKNIIDFIIHINNKNYDTIFKYDFISIARSYLYKYSDDDIFRYFYNNNYIDSSIYKDFKNIVNNINHMSIRNILEEIISITDMYNKMISIGNINEGIIRISKLLDIADNLSSLGYSIYEFNDYLKELLDSDYDMKYSTDIDNSDSVKIMTIHKSKGLEYHICYFTGLYKQFNISDLKTKFMFDNKYGIIAPCFNNGIKDTMYKYLVKYNYIEEEISEKIRLFYVALTRAKEKMIFILPSIEANDNRLDDNNTINIITRLKYRSLADMLNSIKSKIESYYKEIDIDKLNISKEYLYKIKKDRFINKNDEKIIVKEIPVNEEIMIEEKHYSKKGNKLIDKDIYDNMEYGTKIHEILEYIDFINPDYSLINDDIIKKKINRFINNEMFNSFKDCKIYKEFEFIDDNKSHGIIDLLLEYSDKIYIIDYKLRNIDDDNYIKQLKGYKEYIESISKKQVSTYLYSIIEEKIELI